MRLRLRVDTQVSPVTAQVTEASPTVITQVRFLSSVHALVSSVTCEQAETVPTLVTLVRFLLRVAHIWITDHSGVSNTVHRCVVFAGECLPG